MCFVFPYMRRGYARAYNEVELTGEMKSRREASLRQIPDHGSFGSIRELLRHTSSSRRLLEDSPHSNSFCRKQDSALSTSFSKKKSNTGPDVFSKGKPRVDKSRWPVHPGLVDEQEEEERTVEANKFQVDKGKWPMHPGQFEDEGDKVFPLGRGDSLASLASLEHAMESMEFGGQKDVIFHENAIEVFGEHENDLHIHRHEVKLYREGECLEEQAAACGMKRVSSIVALAGSIIGVLERADLNPVLLNNPTAHHTLEAYWKDVEPIMLIGEALSKKCPSAMVPRLDAFELRRLNRGAQLDDWEAGHELLKIGRPCYSIFMVLDGELSVLQKDEDGNMKVRLFNFSTPLQFHSIKAYTWRIVCQEIGVLGEGKTVGEVGMICGSKATSTVLCKIPCALIELPAESSEVSYLSA